jgi:HD-like signal output (HDOD) protein
MPADFRSELKGHILAVKDLPTLPKVLDKVAALVADPSSSTEQIAKVISTDQVLSAKVLKMVNSPIYGFPGRIGSVNHALVLLGYNVIRGVIISTSVFDAMSKAMEGLWEHSVAAAAAGRVVAEAAGLKDPEEYAVSGLLHDLGKVVWAVQLPQLRPKVEALVSDRDLTFAEAEEEVLGFGHDMVNAWLANHWHLPVNLKEGMSHHHKPMLAQHYPNFAAVVHVADFLARLFESGSGGDDGVPVLHKEALKLLKLGTTELERIMDDLSVRLVEVSDLSPV